MSSFTFCYPIARKNHNNWKSGNYKGSKKKVSKWVKATIYAWRFYYKRFNRQGIGNKNNNPLGYYPIWSIVLYLLPGVN